MLFIRWIVSSIAIGIVAYLLPGVTVTPLGALILAVVLGIINLFIKPVIKLLTLPLTILTLGLFSLVVNALLILLASAIMPNGQFSVSGFWSAFFFAILLSLVNAVFHTFEKKS